MKKSFYILIAALSLAAGSLAHAEIAVEKRLLLNVSKELLWKALTTEEHLGTWWGKGVRLEPKVGGEFYEPWGMASSLQALSHKSMM